MNNTKHLVGNRVVDREFEECRGCGYVFDISDIIIYKKPFLNTHRCVDCARKFNRERAIRYRATDAGKKATRRATMRSQKLHRIKTRARQKVNYHIRNGLIIRPKQCKCGVKKVEAHHNDYSKPLEVTWLCRSCHSNLHRNI